MVSSIMPYAQSYYPDATDSKVATLHNIFVPSFMIGNVVGTFGITRELYHPRFHVLFVLVVVCIVSLVSADFTEFSQFETTVPLIRGFADGFGFAASLYIAY